MLWFGVRETPGCLKKTMCFRSSFSDKCNIEEEFPVQSGLWFPAQVHISRQLQVGGMACRAEQTTLDKQLLLYVGRNFYKPVSSLPANHTSFYSPFIWEKLIQDSDHGQRDSPKLRNLAALQPCQQDGVILLGAGFY